MDSLPPFKILLLAEIILLLLVVLFFMGLYVVKLRALNKKLRDKFQDVKMAYEEKKQALRNAPKNQEGINGKQALADYFTHEIAAALARYEHHTQAKIPKIDAEQSYSAKTAALRYLYLSAEKEAIDDKISNYVGWSFYEKKLADVIHWFGKQKTPKQQVRSNRMRLLQERIDVLKPYETENKQLQRDLERAKKRQKQLEEYQRESKATISKLQKMLNALRPADDAEIADILAVDILLPPEDYLTNSSDHLDTIAGIADDKGRKFKHLIDELENYQLDADPEAKQKLESSLKMLELELMKSDRHITNLKQQLKDAKTQATHYAVMLSDAQTAPDNHHGAIEKEVRQQEDGLFITHVESAQTLSSPAPIVPMDYLDHEKVISEIKQLRDNNKVQRNLIVNLEHEINVLRNSILPGDDEQVSTQKKQEVNRLERMVKECQDCIETLESEVDHLYLQLQERAATSTPLPPENSSEVNIATLNAQLTSMAEKMEHALTQYQQAQMLNRFIFDFMKTTAVPEAAKNIVQYLKELKAPIGFYIDSTVGKAEYFPSALFNDQHKELVKSPTLKEAVVYLPEGTLFTGEKIHLMLLADGGNHKSLDVSLNVIALLVSGHIQRIEMDKILAKRAEGLTAWMGATKNHLADLDIQYAYQVEENRKTFQHFISELRQAYGLLDLKGSGLIILDNAINEYEERMHMLLSSSDLIDREISNLITHIDQLQTY